jgi:hypothetical protein
MNCWVDNLETDESSNSLNECLRLVHHNNVAGVTNVYGRNFVPETLHPFNCLVAHKVTFSTSDFEYGTLY